MSWYIQKRKYIFWCQTQNRTGETRAWFSQDQFPSPVSDCTTCRWHKEECRMFTPYTVCLSIWQEDKFCPLLETGRWHDPHFYKPTIYWWYLKIGKENYFLKGKPLYNHALAHQVSQQLSNLFLHGGPTQTLVQILTANSLAELILGPRKPVLVGEGLAR